MRNTNRDDFEPRPETLAVLLEHLCGRALLASELEKLLGIVLRVCDAAALAHRCNLLHGNLEPGNVTIGSHGEVDVTDATIAIGSDHVHPDATSENAGRSPSGQRNALGTVAYMAPEQAWGRRHDFDARTDVYGIGGILYAILTRMAPHAGGSASADLALAQGGTVRGPREACPERELPAALCRIAVRALSANPGDRHPSVEVLRHDIEHFLDAHQPVVARAPAQESFAGAS